MQIVVAGGKMPAIAQFIFDLQIGLLGVTALGNLRCTNPSGNCFRMEGLG
jgi:uncharacterized membrane protein YfbV (UPF0208 family)